MSGIACTIGWFGGAVACLSACLLFWITSCRFWELKHPRWFGVTLGLCFNCFAVVSAACMCQCLGIALVCLMNCFI